MASRNCVWASRAAKFLKISFFSRAFASVRRPLPGIEDVEKFADQMHALYPEHFAELEANPEFKHCVVRPFAQQLGDGRIVMGSKWYSVDSEEDVHPKDKRKLLKTMACEIDENGNLKKFDGEIVFSDD